MPVEPQVVCSWSQGITSGLIGAGTSLAAALAAGLVWVGYHKRKHEDLDAVQLETAGKLNGLIQDHNSRTEQCPVHLIDERQKTVFRIIDEFRIEIREFRTEQKVQSGKIDRLIGRLDKE